MGIIGVIATITISTIVTRIQNKGYVERMKKAYSLIQNVTTQVINEEGKPSNWILDSYSLETHEPNVRVVDMYASKMNYAKVCYLSPMGGASKCTLKPEEYKCLNGSEIDNKMNFTTGSYQIFLTDGAIVALKFMSNTGGGYYWGNPPLMFVVDVNGNKKPNKTGRDIFYFYLRDDENGEVHPYGHGKLGGILNPQPEPDCNKEGEGYTCAQKIITEGKMNY